MCFCVSGFWVFEFWGLGCLGLLHWGLGFGFCCGDFGIWDFGFGLFGIWVLGLGAFGVLGFGLWVIGCLGFGCWV